MDKWLTIKEAVLFFGGKVSARLLYRLTREGKLPSVKLGGKVLIPLDGLEAFTRASRTLPDGTERPQATTGPHKPPKRPTARPERPKRCVLVNGRWQEQ